MAPEESVAAKTTWYTPATAKGWLAAMPSPKPPSPKLHLKVMGPPSGSIEAEASRLASSPTRTGAGCRNAATGGSLAGAEVAGPAAPAAPTATNSHASVRYLTADHPPERITRQESRTRARGPGPGRSTTTVPPTSSAGGAVAVPSSARMRDSRATVDAADGRFRAVLSGWRSPALAS